MESTDSPKPRYLAGAALGLLAAVTGAAVWYGVMVSTGKEYGLVAILLGLWVGGAVRMGSGSRGGLACRLLAVFLTYGAMAASYVPLISEELAKQVATEQMAQVPSGVETASLGDEAAAVTPDTTMLGSDDWAAIYVGSIVAALTVPFAGGLMGMLIAGIALFEAWKINAESSLYN